MDDGNENYLQKKKTISQTYFFKMLNTPKFFSIGKKIILSTAKFIPSLNHFIESTKVIIPEYLWDFNSLEQRLKEYPGVNFVGHGPLFWKGISTEKSNTPYPKSKINEAGITCLLLEKYSNLYGDLSGQSGYNALNRDHIFARNFLEGYSHKLLYATDNTDYKLKELLYNFNLEKQHYKTILGNNAEKLITR